LNGAEAAGMPIIIQITPAARNYIYHKYLEGIIKAVKNIFPSVNYSVIN
jgi:fructose/tagatose bisphosphate aldolase